MQCVRVTESGDRLLDPSAAAWTGIAGESIKLDATPLANQPSEYIKASFDERKIGKVKSLLVQTAHNGDEIFFRLTWEDSSRNGEVTDNNEFPDGCGILMPLNGGSTPVLDEMGSRDAPVNAWFWRADLGDEARNTLASGLGTTRFSERCAVRAKSTWGEGAWAVVFARPLAVPAQPEEAAQLTPGSTAKVAFAVWEGSNGERAGVKSFSKEWRDLVLAP
jgi:DMSO reductase family type II enzyme heme b subunit